MSTLMKSEFDPITKPLHYVEGRNIEPIDVIDDWELDFCLGNTLKYISRCGRKGEELEDLKKAKWYLERKIKKAELEFLKDKGIV